MADGLRAVSAEMRARLRGGHFLHQTRHGIPQTNWTAKGPNNLVRKMQNNKKINILFYKIKIFKKNLEQFSMQNPVVWSNDYMDNFRKWKKYSKKHLASL